MTVGVDLSVQPKKTGVAWIDWSSSEARVRDLVPKAADELITRAVMEADKAGIDCPLGWPEKFVEFISAHQAGNVIVPAEVAGRNWQRALAYRVTDEAVRHETGLVPLSVAADRIAYTAMRCAGLLAQLARKGQPVAHGWSGSGGVWVVRVLTGTQLQRLGAQLTTARLQHGLPCCNPTAPSGPVLHLSRARVTNLVTSPARPSTCRRAHETSKAAPRWYLQQRSQGQGWV
jgi:Protein of unknown function (DUF429)